MLKTHVADTREVVRALMEYIECRKLSTGSRLPPIRTLADEWGMSASTVRDGLLQAENLGLVKVYPRFGTFVESPDVSPLIDGLEETLSATLMYGEKNLLHLLDARIAIEADLVGKAAVMWRPEDLVALRDALREYETHHTNSSARVQADEAFHLRIAEVTGNSILRTFLRVLLTMLRPYKVHLALSEEYLADTDSLHRDIYTLILERKPEESRQVMIRHLEVGRTQVLEQLKALPSESGLSRS